MCDVTQNDLDTVRYDLEHKTDAMEADIRRLARKMVNTDIAIENSVNIVIKRVAFLERDRHTHPEPKLDVSPADEEKTRVPRTVAEVQALVTFHNSLPPNDRILHNPPIIEIAKYCIKCGEDLTPFICGWGELQHAADTGREIPVRIGIDPDGCDSCHPELDELGASEIAALEVDEQVRRQSRPDDIT